MQFLKPSAIFFASIAVAVAEHQHGMQHFHRRQMNSTSSDISTTLTVYQTVVHTITSCAPTITNCPARSSAGAGVITDVIVLTTTICPVSAAESVASSIISAAGGSSNAFTGTPASSTLNTPLGTGLAGGGGQGVSGTSGGIGDSSASGTILTYMLGAGSSTTIATTTLKHTSTATAYVTQYVTRSHSAAAIATGGAAVTQGGAPGTQIGAAVTQTGATGAASQAEQTTTITSSSTMTEYITVMLAPSSSGLPANGVTGGSSTGGNGIGSGNGGESGIGSGSCDCATVAPVTVTVALATVTVTYSPMAASPSAPPSPATSAGSIEVAAASSLTASPSTTAEVMSSFAASSLLANSTAPYGNGTVTVTKPCYGSATGFLTLAKPTETMSAY